MSNTLFQDCAVKKKLRGRIADDTIVNSCQRPQEILNHFRVIIVVDYLIIATTEKLCVFIDESFQGVFELREALQRANCLSRHCFFDIESFPPA